MNRKIITALLAVSLTAGMMTGCAGGEKAGEVKELEMQETKDTTAQLSSLDYDFETEYMFGDFNANSRADMNRQDGIDTFEEADKEKLICQDITYEELMYLLQQEGNHLIQLSGSWCHNSRAMSPTVLEYAKEYGIDTIYMYDFNIDNNQDGQFFVRQSNEKTTKGTPLNYMYGEMVSRYLTNLNDWVEYPKDAPSALTYTNAKGEEITLPRLQQPYMFLYNKDNKVDNSGSGNGSKDCPVVYAFEKMVERDSKGIYVNERDDDGNPVLDEEGNPVRKYVDEEFKESMKPFFDYIKDNNIKTSNISKEEFTRDAFNSYGTEIFKANEKVNIYPTTYRQLEWLLKEDGNALVMFGGTWDDSTRAVAPIVNDYAVKNNVRVYLCDTRMDNDYTTGKWGYTRSIDYTDGDSLVNRMYTNLIESYFTNITTARTTDDGTPKLEVPYLMAYNKDALDEDGFTAPVAAYSELTNYQPNPEKRFYIGEEANTEACRTSVEVVFDAYLAGTGEKAE